MAAKSVAPPADLDVVPATLESAMCGEADRSYMRPRVDAKTGVVLLAGRTSDSVVFWDPSAMPLSAAAEGEEEDAGDAAAASAAAAAAAAAAGGPAEGSLDQLRQHTRLRTLRRGKKFSGDRVSTPERFVWTGGSRDEDVADDADDDSVADADVEVAEASRLFGSGRVVNVVRGIKGSPRGACVLRAEGGQADYGVVFIDISDDTAVLRLAFRDHPDHPFAELVPMENHVFNPLKALQQPPKLSARRVAFTMADVWGAWTKAGHAYLFADGLEKMNLPQDVEIAYLPRATFDSLLERRGRTKQPEDAIFTSPDVAPDEVPVVVVAGGPTHVLHVFCPDRGVALVDEHIGSGWPWTLTCHPTQRDVMFAHCDTALEAHRLGEVGAKPLWTCAELKGSFGGHSVVLPDGRFMWAPKALDETEDWSAQDRREHGPVLYCTNVPLDDLELEKEPKPYTKLMQHAVRIDFAQAWAQACAGLLNRPVSKESRNYDLDVEGLQVDPDRGLIIMCMSGGQTLALRYSVSRRVKAARA